MILKPAPAGTGLIGGGGMRPVLEAVGVTDAVGKSLGSKNRLNVVKATLNALMKLRPAGRLFVFQEVAVCGKIARRVPFCCAGSGRNVV